MSQDRLNSEEYWFQVGSAGGTQQPRIRSQGSLFNTSYYTSEEDPFGPVDGGRTEEAEFTTLRPSERQLTTDEKIALRKLIPFIVDLRKLIEANGSIDKVVDSFFKHANEERPDPISLVTRVAAGVLTEVYPDFKSEIDEEVEKKRAEDQARIDKEAAELKAMADTITQIDYIQKKTNTQWNGNASSGTI